MEESIHCSSITAKQKEISGLDSNGEAVVVKKEEVLSIKLLRGFCAENKIRKAVISLLLVAVGFYGGYPSIMRYFSDFILKNPPEVIVSASGSGLGFFMFIWAIIGLYMLFELLKRSYFLEIKTEKDTRNITFDKSLSKTEIINFIEQLTYRFGYPSVVKIKRNLTN